MSSARWILGFSCVFALLASAVRGESDGEIFKKRLIADLTRGVEREHAALAKPVAAGTASPAVTHVWALSAMITLHAQTGDARMIEWAKADLLKMVHDAAA